MKFAIFSLSFFFIFLSLNAQNKNYQELMEQDWAELKRYEQANKKIIEDSNWPDAVFMGNSITQGWFDTHPEFFQKNNYVSRGIGGQTTPQMLIRFIPDVLDLKPKVVVILAGTNDIAGNTGYSSIKMISDNIKAMALLAKQKNIKVILCSILPVYEYPWRPEVKPVPLIRELNSWLQNYASENNHLYVNFYDILKNEKNGMKAKYAEDGVHPNQDAYKLIEPIVNTVITQALSQ